MDPVEDHATVEELEARKAEIVSRLKDLDAEYANRAFSTEARDEWNELNTERDGVQAKIEELQARAARLNEIAEDQPTPKEDRMGFTPVIRPASMSGDIYDLSTVVGRADDIDGMHRQVRDRALKAIEIGRYSEEGDKEDRQSAAEHTLERTYDPEKTLARQLIQTGSPLYERAFFKTLTGRALTSDEARAMSVGTTTAGGFLLPFTLDPTIILTSDGQINPIRSIARVEQTATNTWKGVTGTGGTASYDAEFTQVSDDSPTLAQPVVDALKAQYFVPFSREFEEDFSRLRAELTMLVTDAKDALEADKFLTGVGSTEPEGLLVGATTAATTASTAVIAVGEIYSLKDAIPARFQGRGRFVGNSTVYSKIRQLDTSGGASLWTQLADPDPDRLIGYPSHIWSNYDAWASGATVLTFGDFTKYLIVDRVGMGIDLIPHLFGGTGTTHYPTGAGGFYAHWRNSGTVLVSGAFKSLVLL